VRRTEVGIALYQARPAMIIMNPPAWLSALFPLAACQLKPLTLESEVKVWHATLCFTPWSPGHGVLTPPRKETYGRMLINGGDGHWSVAEVELVPLLRSVGWNARWVDKLAGPLKDGINESFNRTRCRPSSAFS
jgi:hypothetical protein